MKNGRFGLVAQLGERCVRIAEVEGSIPFESTKRKCDLFRQVAFSFGFRSRWSLHPSVIEMLGRSEFALCQGFACGKTLVRRKGAAGQKAGWMLLKKNCKRPERIWIVTPCHVGASVISLAPTWKVRTLSRTTATVLFSIGAKPHTVAFLFKFDSLGGFAYHCLSIQPGL